MSPKIIQDKTKAVIVTQSQLLSPDLHRLCSCWICQKRRFTRVNDVTMAFVYIFQDGRKTSQLLLMTELGSKRKMVTIFTWFSANTVISIYKVIFLSLLVSILLRMEHSSWSKALHWHSEHSSGGIKLIHESIHSCNVLLGSAARHNDPTNPIFMERSFYATCSWLSHIQEHVARTIAP